MFSDPSHSLLIYVAEEDAHNSRVTHGSAYRIRGIVAQSPKSCFCRWGQSVRADEKQFFFG